MRKGLQLFPLNFCWGTKVSTNKAFEVQLSLGKIYADWFRFSLETRTQQDHAGVYFTLELLTLVYFHAWFYDVRHWNYEAGRFYREGEPYED